METTNISNAAVIFDSHRKEVIRSLKERIAQLVEEQKIFKENRKTVNFKGMRKYEPWIAAMKASWTSHNLRILYAAYGILRGKKITEIENHIPKSWLKNYHPLIEYYPEIDLVLKKYGYQSIKRGIVHNWNSVDDDYYEEIVRIGGQES